MKFLVRLSPEQVEKLAQWTCNSPAADVLLDQDGEMVIAGQGDDRVVWDRNGIEIEEEST